MRIDRSAKRSVLTWAALALIALGWHPPAEAQAQRMRANLSGGCQGFTLGGNVISPIGVPQSCTVAVEVAVPSAEERSAGKSATMVVNASGFPVAVLELLTVQQSYAGREASFFVKSVNGVASNGGSCMFSGQDGLPTAARFGCMTYQGNPSKTSFAMAFVVDDARAFAPNQTMRADLLGQLGAMFNALGPDKPYAPPGAPPQASAQAPAAAVAQAGASAGNAPGANGRAPAAAAPAAAAASAQPVSDDRRAIFGLLVGSRMPSPPACRDDLDMPRSQPYCLDRDNSGKQSWSNLEARADTYRKLGAAPIAIRINSELFDTSLLYAVPWLGTLAVVDLWVTQDMTIQVLKARTGLPAADATIDLLTRKYGKSTSRDFTEWRNNQSGQLAGKTLNVRWNLSDLTVDFETQRADLLLGAPDRMGELTLHAGPFARRVVDFERQNAPPPKRGM